MSYLLTRNAFFGSAVFAVALAIFCTGVMHSNIPWQSPFKTSKSSNFICEPHQYSTEIVSIDPLVIYINNFTSSTETTGLIEAGYLYYITPPLYFTQLIHPAHHTSQSPKSTSAASRDRPLTGPPNPQVCTLPTLSYNASSHAPAHSLGHSLH